MRQIIVAAGIEIRDFQGRNLLAFLNSHADAKKGSVWTYPKGAGAKATIEVRVVYTMAEFATALNTDDAYVIYEGHSRYGQGPAFGPAHTPHVPDVKAFPTNPWGVHFRMGYDATDTECIDDLYEHSVQPHEYDLPAASRKAFLPDALTRAGRQAKDIERRRKAGKLTRAERKRPCTIAGAWRMFDRCQPAIAALSTARKEQPLQGRHYYAHKLGARKPRKPEDEYLTSVTVGSADLDASLLKCDVLFMASCSSHVHFFKALERRRRAVKSSTKFYMTAMVCAANHGKHFIEQVFKGHDPASKKGSKAVLKALNGADNAGIVGIY